MAIPESVEVAADVVVTYITNNPMRRADLTSFIRGVLGSRAWERVGKHAGSSRGQNSSGARSRFRHPGIFDVLRTAINSSHCDVIQEYSA